MKIGGIPQNWEKIDLEDKTKNAAQASHLRRIAVQNVLSAGSPFCHGGHCASKPRFRRNVRCLCVPRRRWVDRYPKTAIQARTYAAIVLSRLPSPALTGRTI